MATGTGSSDSESTGGEEWERFREAVWDAGPQRACLKPSNGNFSKSKLPPAVSTNRHKVSDHGQDQNELKTTPEFRAHVAKKLGSILDSSITILEHMPGHVKTCTKASETDDDGFRLFSSSVPGANKKPEPSPLQSRQLQHSSSSETDEDQEWQRCQEAAVSAADILKQSGLQAPLLELSNGHRCEITESCRKEKRRRKKVKVTEESVSEQVIIEKPHENKVTVRTEKPSCLSGVHKKEEHVATEDTSKKVTVIKKKKKKRKKMEARTE
ncbi:protein CUSTOS [Heteronotia binoei]|uniref:protein CUSTOS n=1 Tax=Heteronotia binoei TaxID=13085 RepID=UPI002930E93B|nr:protein CUSTOS [Heteronotia binoei]